MIALPTQPRGVLLTLAVLGLVACSRDHEAQDAGPSRVEAAPTTTTRDAAPGCCDDDRPRYDEDGVPLPDVRQALGAAIPLGFTRIKQGRGAVFYHGPIEAQKVLAFYRKYLDCSEVRQTARGWHFTKASPRPPGDPSRLLDVAIHKARANRSLVIIIDLMGRSKVTIPDGGPATFDELYKMGHQGTERASPIPGTY